MASRLAPTAFPTECIHSLPSIHDFVKDFQTLFENEDTEVRTEADTNDFVLVQADVPIPMQEVSRLTLEEAKSDAQTIRQHLLAAWNVDPLKALKLVAFLRDVRDGKGCTEEFYIAAQWLLNSHPETFKHNIVRFCPRFGYWKDLLELLVRDFL